MFRTAAIVLAGLALVMTSPGQASVGPTCFSPVAIGETLSGSLSSVCPSAHRSPTYAAAYFTFTVPEKMWIGINVSDETFDDYFYLFPGTDPASPSIASSDWAGISAELSPGDYTVEVTTYWSNSPAGTFKVTVRELIDVSFGAPSASVAEGDVILSVPVTRSGRLSEIVAVPCSFDAYATQAATEGKDFLAPDSPIVLQANQTRATVPIRILDDALAEDTESFEVYLPTWQFSDGVRSGRSRIAVAINDDLDEDPTISLGDVAAYEGNIGKTEGRVPITLSGASGRRMQLRVATADGTATGDIDYDRIALTDVAIEPGATSTSVSFAIIGDGLIEPSEIFSFDVVDATNGRVRDGIGTVTIVDDDSFAGDANADGLVDAGDVVFLVNYLFAGGAAPTAMADVNADTRVDALDVYYLINYLFAGGQSPVPTPAASRVDASSLLNIGENRD